MGFWGFGVIVRVQLPGERVARGEAAVPPETHGTERAAAPLGSAVQDADPG